MITQPTADTLGMYLSIPFCKAKCSFCNFASDAFPPARMAAYIDALCAELEAAHTAAAQHGLHIPPIADTIFIGGGTPSLLEPAQMRRIFATLRKHFNVDPTAEITVEAAPGQIADDLLEALLDSGVNRISLGVQSFIDEESRAVGRLHTAAQCLTELDRLRTAGIPNLNIDLIAGLPHQTAASWATSLHTAIASGVDHISVYMLEVDEDSRLGRELIGPNIRYGAPATPTETLVAELYEQACTTLQQPGLAQYEISNFARPAHHSRHNLKYWTRAPYLGFGLDAHSMLKSNSTGAAARFANTDDLETYINNRDTREIEHIDALAAWEESIFLGLRLIEGVSLSSLRAEYPAAWVSAFQTQSKELASEGFMRITNDRIALTPRGRIVSSSIFGELLAGDLAVTV